MLLMTMTPNRDSKPYLEQVPRASEHSEKLTVTFTSIHFSQEEARNVHRYRQNRSYGLVVPFPFLFSGTTSVRTAKPLETPGLRVLHSWPHLELSVCTYWADLAARPCALREETESPSVFIPTATKTGSKILFNKYLSLLKP